MTPERAMKGLVSAALANNVGAVARLFDSEPLEMPSVALVRAIAVGNTDVALDLAGRGVAFEPYLQPAPQHSVWGGPSSTSTCGWERVFGMPISACGISPMCEDRAFACR